MDPQPFVQRDLSLMAGAARVEPGHGGKPLLGGQLGLQQLLQFTLDGRALRRGDDLTSARSALTPRRSQVWRRAGQ